MNDRNIPQLSIFHNIGVVDEVIQKGKKGRVRFDGSYWPAYCLQNVTLMPGDHCRIVGQDQITLIVETVQ